MAGGMGAGVSAADFDRDGDIDLFVPTAAGSADRLYENRGGFQFEEIARVAGVDSRGPGRAALWMDFTGDGWLDLVVAGDYFMSGGREVPRTGNALRFYEQIPGEKRFVDVSAQSGVSDAWMRNSSCHLGGLCAGDLNNDGWLDLLVSLFGGSPKLFLGGPEGRFTAHASDVIGVNKHHWQPVMCDFNKDGWLDIYDPLDFEPNRLLLNQRDLTFQDVAVSAGVDNAMNDMGIAMGDYDNDGDFDLYSSNIDDAAGGRYSVLFRNDSDGSGGISFTNRSHAAGVERGGWGWGCTFFDVDNDGWLDLAVTNGWFGQGFERDRSILYHNRGDSSFADISSSCGFNDTDWGSSLIAADLDRDGDLDLVQTVKHLPEGGASLRLLENRQIEKSENNFLVVSPSMAGPNTGAVGAVVQIELPNGQTLSRQITTGCSFLGQEPGEAFFGVGTAEKIAVLRIEWPDGSVTVEVDVEVNQIIAARNNRAWPDISVKPDGGGSLLVRWYGGVLEELVQVEGVPGWSPVVRPANPLRVHPGESPGRMFRVSE